MERPLEQLRAALDFKIPVLVQTHDFPDHDAMGAAYALCELLLRLGYECSITYGGIIQSISLASMIDQLDIPLLAFEDAVSGPERQTIVVDGSPAAGTIKATAGRLVGVIDHHPSRKPMKCPFVDVRTQTGSCSAIIWSYWKEAGEEPDKTTATALLAGIQLDTDFLSRRVSVEDLNAHYDLFFKGNSKLAREVVRTALSLEQLPEIGRALMEFRVNGVFLLTEVHGDYSSELLSVLADFLLRLKEIQFVTVIEVSGGEYRLSARSRSHDIDAGEIIRRVLSGKGTGGGHPHMAGGFIKPNKYPGAERLLLDITNAAAEYRSENETDSQGN